MPLFGYGYLVPYLCKDGTVVKALASYQCCPGSISGLGVICGLSLLLVLVLALLIFKLKKEVSEAYFNANKGMLKCQPFLHRVYRTLISSFNVRETECKVNSTSK